MIASLVAGWVWVVAHASRAFGTPLVLSGKNNEVLSVWLWIHWQDGFIPQASAIGVVLTVLIAIIGLFARRLLARTQLPGMGRRANGSNQPVLFIGLKMQRRRQ
jgi:ABC-type Fe3+ transport system permease subunit